MDNSTTFCLCTHWSIGHLGGFYFLTVISNVTCEYLCTSFCVHTFLFRLDIYLGVGLLDHMVILFLAF